MFITGRTEHFLLHRLQLCTNWHALIFQLVAGHGLIEERTTGLMRSFFLSFPFLSFPFLSNLFFSFLLSLMNDTLTGVTCIMPAVYFRD